MIKTKISRYQNRKNGLNLLKRGLGVAGFIQFMQDYGLNEGDYTNDRQKWLKEKDVNTLINNIKNYS